jgi:outer membrane protein TolC
MRLMNLSTRRPSLALMACFALSFRLSAQAQQHTPPGGLPEAPSAVRALEDEALAKPAGSAFKFTAASTERGPGGLTIEHPQEAPLAISIDDAIALGLERNVRIRYDRATQDEARGATKSLIGSLMPDLKVSASSEAQEINLAGLGFKPSLFAGTHLLPPGFVLNEIVKVNTTQALVNADQQLFNMPDFELYRGIKSEVAVVDLNALSGRGDLVLAVGTAYLQVLADQSNLTNAQAEELATQTLYEQSKDRRDAGVGTNLDALRAQVQFQQRQQETIAAASALQKDIIQLNRIMGMPAAQKLQLTDAAPFSEIQDMNLDRAKTTAYVHRKDLLALEAEIDVADKEMRAVRYQRLPTIAFNGFYGVLGQTTGLYHGVFTAMGTLKFPIFREAEQRGEEEQANAQLTSLRQREADLRVTVDAQIRASMLDVQSSYQQVQVAQSNITLAQQELSDERDRFGAGIDTNLPVEDAEASVTGAQAQLVQALLQYNIAKLVLARNTGIIETRYRAYLGK